MKRMIISIMFVVIFMIGIWLLHVNNSKPQVIGVIQYMHHPLLDETYRGLFDELTRLGLNDGEHFRIETRVADRNSQLCAQIARQFVAQNAPVIVAIATPAAQAVVSVSENTPIVFAAITDPVAAHLVKSIEKPEGKATGTSNRWPFEKQLKLIPKILPNAKNIGVVWNPGEVNSDAAMKYIRPIASNMGLNIVEVPVSSTADVALAARSIAGRIDAFLMIPDNTVLSATATLVQIAKDTKKPLIGGDKNTVQQGSLASFGYNYYELGQITAQMIKSIIIDHKSPANMAVRFPPNASLIVNPVSAKGFGITIPDELLDSAEEIVKN